MTVQVELAPKTNVSVSFTAHGKSLRPVCPTLHETTTCRIHPVKLLQSIKSLTELREITLLAAKLTSEARRFQMVYVMLQRREFRISCFV